MTIYVQASLLHGRPGARPRPKTLGGEWRDRIYRITPDGHIEYEQSCKHKMQNMTSTEAPVDVPADFGRGLKPGHMVAMMIDEANNKRVGIPVGVWTNSDKKQLIGIFGLTW